MSTVTPLYHAETYRVEEGIGYLVNKLAQAIAKDLEHRMANLGLTDAQWKPLLLLRQGGCTTAADLSRIACHDTGAVTRILDRLEAKGLIKRSRSTEDRRVIHLELTDEGKTVAAEVPKIIVELANKVLAGFSSEEFDVFKDLLSRALINARQLSDGHGLE